MLKKHRKLNFFFLENGRYKKLNIILYELFVDLCLKLDPPPEKIKIRETQKVCCTVLLSTRV